MLLAKLIHYAAHDTEMRKRNLEPDAYDLASVLSLCANGTKFTCLTGTKKGGQMLTQRHTCSDLGEFTCFTSTKVQILTKHHTCSDLRAGDGPLRARQGTQFKLA